MSNEKLRELDRYHLAGLWSVYEGYSMLKDEVDSGGEFVLLEDVENLINIPKHESLNDRLIKYENCLNCKYKPECDNENKSSIHVCYMWAPKVAKENNNK